MQKLTRLALMLTAVAITTGCRMYEEQKAMIVQSATAAVFTPFVEAQRTTPLTQGTFRKASKVAPTNGSTTAVDAPKPIVTATVEKRRSERVISPCQSTFVDANRRKTVVGG